MLLCVAGVALQAKRVCEEMKENKKYQYKLLQRQIELCELANGLVHNFAALTVRETSLTVAKLLEADIEVPWSVKVNVNEKLITGLTHELATPGASQQDLWVIQSKCLSSSIVFDLQFFTEGQRVVPTGWRPANAAFCPP